MAKTPQKNTAPKTEMDILRDELASLRAELAAREAVHIDTSARVQQEASAKAFEVVAGTEQDRFKNVPFARSGTDPQTTEGANVASAPSQTEDVSHTIHTSVIEVVRYGTPAVIAPKGA
jgi:hypothetical protein